MSEFVIGVDGGASKTSAVVMDRQAQVMGRGRGGSSNVHVVGLAGMRRALWDAMQEAASSAGVDLSQAARVTWALAGSGRAQDTRQIEELQGVMLPGTRGQVVTDALAALMGGAGTRIGAVLIAGTGMIAYGENAAGDQARAGGWGYALDRGSAYSLAQQALRAVARAADQSDLPTGLSKRIIGFLGLAQASDLVRWIYAPERAVSDIAALAPLVLDTAQAGDLVAAEVVALGADALADAAAAVAGRLNLESNPFPLVLAGRLLTNNEFYRQVVNQAVRTRLPSVRPQLPHDAADVGAGLLALESLGYALSSATWNEPPAKLVWTSEQRNVLTNDLDLLTTLEMVGLMHLADRRAVAALRPNLPAIATAVDAIAARMIRGGRLIYVGAGTSGRLGALDAAECPPTFNADPGQVVGIMAGGRTAFATAKEGAEDDRGAGRLAIAETETSSLDSVVGIAASGRTPFVAGALEEARDREALTVALICNLPSPLAGLADHVIAPLVGPEIITGSTRLKAGTAQKLVLNMLSTLVMVRLGKTYGNLMVDMRQQNLKLRDRAVRIVAEACGIDEARAEDALDASQRDVKVAIVSQLIDDSPEEARALLAQAGGLVREALAGAQ
ncbi:MAG: N-acetylmuramic acid 6-phosphate etherase [Chloroflexota bacterium]|nr:N-acetylmuramic acid 6-phosphate etherase [Chloroflexota bacterium]